MTGFDATKTTRNSAVNDDIVAKDTVNSIDPADVGNNIIQNLEALTPFIEAINNFTFYNGTSNPNDANGVEGDVYQQTNGGSSITIWRKTTTNWVIQDILPLGITFQNGIITGLRTQLFVDTLSVNVTSGSWAINNVIYSKAIPTVINYNAPEVGSDRIDTIYADTNGDIIYLAGAPSGTPVKPTLPANTIEVDSIYVPAIGTGSTYLFSAGEGVDLSLYATISYVDTLDAQNVKLNPSSPQSGFSSVTGQVRSGSGNTNGFTIGSTFHAYADGLMSGSDAFIANENGGDITLDGYFINLGGALGVKLLTTPTTDATPAWLTTWDPISKEIKKVDASSLTPSLQDVTSVGNTTNLKIGVGTSSPISKVDVEAGIQDDVVNESNAAAFFKGVDVGTAFGQLDAAGNYISWMQSLRRFDNVPFALSINPLGGNVGIGTTTPTAKLDVNGDIKATNLLSGAYTPTVTGLLNATSLAANQCFYTRIGNVVTINGSFGGTFGNVGSNSAVSISLPSGLGSNFTTTADVTGNGSLTSPEFANVYAVADSGTDLPTIYITAIPNASRAVHFTLTYIIK